MAPVARGHDNPDFCALLPRLSIHQNGEESAHRGTVLNCPHARLRYAPRRQTRPSVSSIHWFSDYSTCRVNGKVRSCFHEEHQNHSRPSRTWIKVKNPKAPAATRAADGTF